MSYLVQNSFQEHESMLSSCLSRWAVCEDDMYMVSSEGHRVYTSHRLLAFSSPNFLAHILPSSTETALSLPFSSSSLSLLCNLLSKGMVYSEIAVDKAEVEEAALCLGIHFQLQASTGLQNKNGESEYVDPNISSTFYMAANLQEDVDITENVLDTKDLSNESRHNFTCCQCGKSYSEKSELRNHQQMMHQNRRKIVVKKLLAGEKFAADIVDNIEEDIILNDGKIPCHYCHELYDEKVMTWHIDMNHPEVQTDPLGKSPSMEDFLDFKMEVYDDTDAVGEEEKVSDEKNPKLHICEFCNRKYSKKRNLRIHKNKKHPNQGSEGDIRCKYCPKQFNVFRMYRHVQAKHPHVPPETYENESEHENNIPVDESRKFKCNFCPKSFTGKKYVRKHKLQVHPGKIEKGDVSCIYCGKIFNEGKMFIHVNAKHPEMAMYPLLDVTSDGNDAQEIKTENTSKSQLPNQLEKRHLEGKIKATQDSSLECFSTNNENSPFKFKEYENVCVKIEQILTAKVGEIKNENENQTEIPTSTCSNFL